MWVLTLGVGIVTTALITLALGSNPIGWATVGILASAYIGSMLADWAYQTNKFGLKDKTDWVGHKIDDGMEAVGKSTEAAIDSVKNTVGDAAKSIGKHINPMKWAW